MLSWYPGSKDVLDLEKRQGMPKHYTAFIGFERPCHIPFRVLCFFFFFFFFLKQCMLLRLKIVGSNYVLALPLPLLMLLLLIMIMIMILIMRMMATMMTLSIILERMITLMTMRRDFDAEDDGILHSAYHVTILSGPLSNLVRKM